MPASTAKLWTALGAEAGLGALVAQPVRAAGGWGQLPVGSVTSPIEGLFPRIDEDALAESASAKASGAA